MLSFDNFIDMGSVNPKEQSVESGVKILIQQYLNLEKPVAFGMKLKEYQTELYDDQFNFMGLPEPKQISYMNIEEKVHELPNFWPWYPLHIQLSLSNKIVKQKRIVYDVFMLFGDVGGLNDFLALGLSSFFGLFSAKFQ